MNNVIQRSFTGLTLMAISIAVVLISQYSFIFLLLVINILGLWEFYRLFHSAGIFPRKITGTILSVTLFISSALAGAAVFSWKILIINIPFAFLIFVAELYLRAEKPFQNIAFTFLGILYVTIPFVFLNGISIITDGKKLYHPHIVLGFLFIVWASDIGAYFFGKSFGKHPLFKRISPGKTWEGSAGGTFSALLTAYIISEFYDELHVSA
jgi:phosphatidate cytidylyltransferase